MYCLYTFFVVTMNCITGLLNNSFLASVKLLTLILLQIFTDILYSLLVFTPSSTSLSLASLFWTVITTDHVLKLSTILLKAMLISIPVKTFPISRRVKTIIFYYQTLFFNKLFEQLFIIYRGNVSFSLNDHLTCIEL